MSDTLVINTSTEYINLSVITTTEQYNLSVTAPEIFAYWGTIFGVLSTQTDLWRVLSAKALEVDLQSLSGQVVDLETFIATVSSTWNGGQEALTVLAGNSAFWDTAFARSTVFSTVSSRYNSSSTVTESNSGNWNYAYDTAVSYSSISSTFATNSTVNGVSSLLTPLTLTNSLTSQLVLNTDFDSYRTDVASATATLLPTTTYQQASGNWQGTFTNVQSNSGNWNFGYNVATYVQANSANWEESSEIIPTVTNYLSTNNVLISGLTVDQEINIGQNLFYFKSNNAASYFPYTVLELYSLQGNTGITNPMVMFGLNGEIIYGGDQAFFGFADRANYLDRTKDGGFYKNNGVINFWNNSISQNTLSISDNGDVYVGPNGYNTYSSDGTTSNIGARLFVDGNISTTSDGNSNQWNEAYTAVVANSANWEESSEIIPTVTNYLSTVPVTLSSADVKGRLLSAGTDLFDIFLTSETDSQTLSYVPSSYNLSISNGNIVNLSSINTTFAANSGKYENVYSNVVSNSANWNTAFARSTVFSNVSSRYNSSSTVVESNSANWNYAYDTAISYSSVSSTFATNSTVNSVSSLLTPLTLTRDLTGQLVKTTDLNTYKTDVASATALLTPLTLTNNLTSQLVLNTVFNNFQTSVGQATATLLPTSIYQNASGNWQGTFTNVQSNSANWSTAFNRSTVFTEVSSRYDSSSTVVEANSANWNQAYNTATVYQGASGTYATTSFVNSNFLNLTGGTITGDLTLLNNLFVNGSAIYVNTQDLIVSDPLIYIAEGNPDDSLDIGVMAAWVEPVSAGGVGYQHGGLVRRVDNKVWTLFKGATAEPLSGVNVDWSQPGIQLEPLSAKFYGDIYGDRNVFGSLSASGPIYGSNLNIANWDRAFDSSTVFSSVSGRYNSSSTVVESNSANWILDGGNTKNSNITIGTNNNFNLNFETANSTRVTIASSGNVGIGTTTPTTSLEVSGTIKARRTETNFQDSVLKVISTESSAGTSWRGRTLIGAEDLTFLMGTYNGIAGLGAHSWTSANTEDGAAWADLTINPDGNANVYIGGSNWDNSTAIVTVQNSNRYVGLNTQTPSSLLDVYSSTLTKSVLTVNESTGVVNADQGFVVGSQVGGLVDSGGHKAQIVAPDASNQTPLTLVGGSALMEFYKDSTPSKAVSFGMAVPGSSPEDDLIFTLYNGSSWSEGFRVQDTTGNVGIGTSSPNQKLTIVGSISATGVIHASGGNSNQWNSTFTNVQSNSANWNTAFNRSTQYQNVSSSFATNSTVNSVSSLLTPLTLTNTLTSQLLPTTVYQQASGNWQNTYTNFSQNSATYCTKSLALAFAIAL